MHINQHLYCINIFVCSWLLFLFLFFFFFFKEKDKVGLCLWWVCSVYLTIDILCFFVMNSKFSEVESDGSLLIMVSCLWSLVLTKYYKLLVRKVMMTLWPKGIKDITYLIHVPTRSWELLYQVKKTKKQKKKETKTKTTSKPVYWGIYFMFGFVKK